MSINMSELLQELAAGEAARAKIPELSQAYDFAIVERNRSQAHAQELELKISNYRDQIDGLLSKVRALEVERDDAGFRELETADKLSTLLKAVRHAATDLDGSAMQVDPPKAPEPVAEAPRAVDPTVASSSTADTPVAQTSGVSSGENAASPGQSEPHPTAPSNPDTTPATASAQPAETQGGVSSGDTSPVVYTRPWWEKEGQNNLNWNGDPTSGR